VECAGQNSSGISGIRSYARQTFPPTPTVPSTATSPSKPREMLAFVLLALPAVTAHAYVTSITVNGSNATSIPTYQPFNDGAGNTKPQRITRPFANNSPTTDVSSNALTCNVMANGNPSAAMAAPIHATIAAGSTLDFHWTRLSLSHRGPCLSYLARCPDRCEDYLLEGGEKVFFKIDEGGYEGNNKVRPAFGSGTQPTPSCSGPPPRSLRITSTPASRYPNRCCRDSISFGSYRVTSKLCH
jgi:hypothetical protein